MLKSVALFCLAILFLHTHFFDSVAVAVSRANNGEIDAMLSGSGGVGESSMEEEEEMMPSEISRRVMMMQRRYISYETLRRDMVPCQKPGASYYDCRSGQANSYSKGCEIITRCARDTSETRT
ncbi:PREDICTED: protein RALF-like 24 [Tarenaya hassleriana]|uniref:protein RALF-like 24 n=1 Tax=Tarenaya hassleriana TaxID=28532 RepID=UPI00053C4728|nr:PREDICTED: protein RALF-like 24 [Tarenaya hassleriana]